MRLIVVAALCAALVSGASAAEAKGGKPSRTECEVALNAYKTGKRNPANWTVSECFVHGILSYDEIAE